MIHMNRESRNGIYRAHGAKAEGRTKTNDTGDQTKSGTRTYACAWCETIILGKAALVAVTTLAIEPRMIAGELATLLF